MKYIMNVAFRYIRRQKSRTLMTFLSISTASFIVIMTCFFLCTAIESSKNYITDTAGSWEVQLTSMIENSENEYELLNSIKNHAVIDDYFYEDVSSVSSHITTISKQKGIVYFDVSFDDKTFSNRSLSMCKNEGNCELTNNTLTTYEGHQKDFFEKHEPDRIVLPEYLKEYGYKINDKIKISVTPQKCVLDMDSDYIKNNFDNEYTHNLLVNIFDMVCVIKADKDGEEAIKSFVTGNTVSHTYTIDGFYNESDVAEILKNNNGQFSFILTSNSFDIINETIKNNAEGLSEEISYYTEKELYASINENVDFQDGIYSLLEDCGYSKNSYNDLFNDECFNSELLILKGKLAFSAVSYAPVVIMLIILLLVIWLLLRFIVDNAFEISAHERTAQFALLRIVGASKKQMKAFVFSEAIFYILTAVPSGFMVAFLTMKGILYFIEKSGVEYVVFNAYPGIIVTGIVLSIISVLISSYTSAFWKSRKKSIVASQTANYKFKKSKKIKEKKIKCIKSHRFILRYTLKNLSRTRGRFIIAVVAISIGVMSFSYFLTMIMTANNMYRKDLDDTCDFMIDAYTGEYYENNCLSLYNEKIENNDNIEWSSINFSFNLNVPEKLELHIISVDRLGYERLCGDKTKVTYDELVKDDLLIVYGDHTEAKDSYMLSQSLETRVADKVSGKHQYHDDYYELIISIETFEKLLEHRNDMKFFGANIEIKMNDNVLYNDALSIVNDFLDGLNVGYMYENMYYCSTGLKTFVSAIALMVLVYIGAIWLSGIITMSNSINTNIHNRKEEFISMRAFGLTMKKLKGMIFLESGMLSVISSAVGFLTGIIPACIMLMLGADKTLFCTFLVSGAVVSIVNILISFAACIPAIKTMQNKVKVNSIE